MEALKVEFEQAARNTQEAEASLKRFLAHPQVLEASRFILDTSGDGIAQFHAAISIKEIITRQTFRQSYEERLKWVQYLLYYAIERYASIQHHVRGALLQAIAISTKIGWMDPKDLVKPVVMKSLSDLLGNEQMESKSLGLVLINALLSEFLFTHGATSLGLPVDFHQSCQASFQKSHLLSIFQMVLQCIHQTINTPSLQNKNFANQSLSCAEKILCWDFTANASALFGNKNEVSLEREKTAPRLPLEWKSIVVVPDVVQLFFQLAHVYAHDPVMAPKTYTCLVQLAGIHGPVFDTTETQRNYISFYVTALRGFLAGIVEHINSRDFSVDSGDKIFGISQMSRLLFANVELALLASCPGILEVMQDIGHITIYCLKLQVDNVEDTWFLDAADDILYMWASVVSRTIFLSPQEMQQLLNDHATAALLSLMSQIASRTVGSYIEMRVLLEPTQDDDEDFDQKDVDNYADQLLNIATLARLNPNEVLQQLISVLGEKSQRLSGLLASLSPDQMEAVMKLQEQIHWSVLIAGHVLCDSAYGETPTIPPTILKLSTECATADPVVQLATTIFGILDSLGFPLESVQHNYLSPLLVETLFWFCDRWASTYLFPSQSDYANLSPSIAHSFGKQGSGNQILGFLLMKTQQQAGLWYSEIDIVQAIVALLHGLSRNRDARDAMIEMAIFSDIVQFFLQNIARLPASTHSPIVQTIVYIASHSSNEALRSSYFKSLCDSIERSFTSIVQMPDFTHQFQSTTVREEIVIALQLFGGLAVAVDESTTVTIFEACARHFDSFVQLLNLYHNYPDVELFILSIFKDLVRHQSFDALQPQHHQVLYKSVHDLIQVYSKNEVGRHRGANNSEEEELFEDLSVLLQLLAELISAEYEGYERETVLARIQKSQFEVDVPKVVFVGVNALLPLVTKEMLDFPKLCLDYVYLVSLLVDYFPDRLAGLPQHLLSGLLESLLFGMHQSVGRISDFSFKAVQSLGLYTWSQMASGHESSRYMVPALEVLLTQIMQSLLLKPLDTSILNEASDSVFALSLCCPTTLQQILSSLVSETASRTMAPQIQKLLQVMGEQHQKQHERLSQGLVEIGWGSPGLERYPSLRPYRKLFTNVIIEARSAILVK
ncbi:Exportin-4 [Kappamyces sp. JEL0680]|nr:Exportin-4 [Kappamyces sp. JEL0680]